MDRACAHESQKSTMEMHSGQTVASPVNIKPCCHVASRVLISQRNHPFAHLHTHNSVSGSAKDNHFDRLTYLHERRQPSTFQLPAS
eukprot:353182-Chlamydomonas_euryale.AAC.56